jgi:hypothetical protein
MKNDPQKFAGGAVLIGLSTVADGDMRTNDKTGTALAQIYQNRAKFLTRNGFSVNETALVWTVYDGENYRRYHVADETWRGRGMQPKPNFNGVISDGLATSVKNLGLFLPLADCLGAVLYDSQHKALMMSHLGRHATEQHGAAASVEFMTKNFDTNPADLQIWLSPAAGAANYPLYKFQNRSLRAVNVEHFIEAGVKAANITGENSDTTIHPHYFSHSQAQKTGQGLGRRFAIVAKIV